MSSPLASLVKLANPAAWSFMKWLARKVPSLFAPDRRKFAERA